MLRVAISAVIVVWAGAAQADIIPRSEIYSGNWSGGAYADDSTGEFTHCVVSTEYRNGHNLYFSVNRDALVGVGVSNLEWTLIEGEEFNVTLTVDQRASYSGVARAVSPESVLFSINDLDNALNAFRRGFVLRLNIADHEAEFELSGTYKALDVVLGCAAYHYNNPPSPPLSTQPPQVSSAPEDKTLLFQIATSMINESGASDFNYLTAEELSDLGFSKCGDVEERSTRSNQRSVHFIGRGDG